MAVELPHRCQWYQHIDVFVVRHAPRLLLPPRLLPLLHRLSRHKCIWRFGRVVVFVCRAAVPHPTAPPFRLPLLGNRKFLEVNSSLPYLTGHKHHLKTKCEGLSLPYLAAGSNDKNVWDLRRNKKIYFRRQFYYSYSRSI